LANKMINRSFFALLAILTISLFTACSNAGEFTRAIMPEESPSTFDFGDDFLVHVHLYIQSTHEMGELLGSDFDRALALLVGTPEVPGTAENLWGTHSIQQSLYRFDVLWMEPERDFGIHGYGSAFAYPLDPSWWIREGVRTQAPQIFEPEFYSINWYLEQTGRAPGVYEQRLFGAGWSNEEQNRISRTITEISELRQSNERELSVVVTNFRGHPSEDGAIRSSILNYLWDNDQQAISTFAFSNNGQEFYFIVLGTLREVSDFSHHLSVRLQASDFMLYQSADDNQQEEAQSSIFAVNSFSMGALTTQISGNRNTSVVDTFRGVRLAFYDDISETESQLFYEHFGDDLLLYNIWPRLIDNNSASIQLRVNLNIPQSLRFAASGNIVAFPAFSVIDADGAVRSISSGNTQIRIDDSALYNGGYVILNVDIDTNIFSNTPQRVYLSLDVYTNVNADTGISLPIGNALFRSTFTQLETNIQREIEQRHMRGGLVRHRVASLHIYILYR